MAVNNIFPIGNDIVDLRTNEPPLHKEYKSRVFTQNETSNIGESCVSHWLHWAAKEAAYKALKQRDPSIIFTPRKFEYFIGDNLVIFGDQVLFCRSQLCSEYVHVSCSTNRELLWCSDLREWIRKIPNDLSSSSQIVREVAVEKIARALNLPSPALNIVTSGSGDNWSGAPSLLIYGSHTAHALSFSHHGQYVAVSFLRQYLPQAELQPRYANLRNRIKHKSFVNFDKEEYERFT